MGCAAHLTPCELCERGGCPECLKTCGSCGARACSDDLVADDLCKRCAVACPGCQTAVVKETLTPCGTCGRKFCPACLPAQVERCVLCGGA